MVAGGWWWWLVLSSCWPILSSHRRIAKFSRLSGLRDCAAVSRKGIARAARLVHTHVLAKLAAAIAKHMKLQQCRRFTWQFASKTFKILLSNHHCCWASIFPFILRSLLCMNMNEYCNIGPRRNTIVTQLFHSSYSRNEFETWSDGISKFSQLRTSIVWEMRGTWKNHHWIKPTASPVAVHMVAPWHWLLPSST